ncbi:MAG: GNAT family N-acetyltransferase [Bacteroidales bacterium]
MRDLETIVDFQMKMALETENLLLNLNVITKGVEAAILDCKKGQIYVAEDENNQGATIGSLMITLEWSDWRNGWVWWIESLYVLPEYRRKGIFKQMYEYLKSLAMANDNIKGIRLYVDKRNTRAQKAYQAIGMNGEHYTTYEWLKE